MRLKAVARIQRKNQVHNTGDAKIDYANEGPPLFQGFPRKFVPATYRSENPIDGEAVACVYVETTDIDFFPNREYLIHFPKAVELKATLESMLKSDETTEKMLGTRWKEYPVSDLAIWLVEKLLDKDPMFGPKLAKHLETKSKRLWRLLSEYAFALHQVKPHIEGINRKRRGS